MYILAIERVKKRGNDENNMVNIVNVIMHDIGGKRRRSWGGEWASTASGENSAKGTSRPSGWPFTSLLEVRGRLTRSLLGVRGMPSTSLI